ncbi:hypothetical protein [Chryseobacterium sp. AG844]|uniref:hypothetical protein n=1 Tax=Chryseobacterium sp. AG844 TaxID=2183998 RepID=UPI000D86096F|nr:hypothetical protein [Chryseobacterium sp. AG844]PWW27200.1 hypothetical protein DEU40_107146 [Chryseobacterium sp. AG844]
MKNKKLFELSKKITENKIPGMKRESVEVIKGEYKKRLYQTVHVSVQMHVGVMEPAHVH